METENYMKNIRRNLMKEYAESNLNSLMEFAWKCKISSSLMNKLIYGNYKKEVYLSTLISISNALGKPISWLIGSDEEKQKPYNCG